MNWILGILPSVIAGGILAIIVVLMIIGKIKERKHGGCGCGCPGCNGHCPHSSVTDIEQKEAN